jgi:hypothetical protein
MSLIFNTVPPGISPIFTNCTPRYQVEAVAAEQTVFPVHAVAGEVLVFDPDAPTGIDTPNK